MSMASLAEAANLNGDATQYTYGASIHNPVTWDAKMIWGCHCDEGWHGYDCSLSTSPGPALGGLVCRQAGVRCGRGPVPTC